MSRYKTLKKAIYITPDSICGLKFERYMWGSSLIGR